MILTIRMDILLNHYATRWAADLEMEKTIGIENHFSMAFSDKDTFGEVLCSLLSGMKGCGTGGSGFDLSSGTYASEVKTVCVCQPWKCDACKRRTPWVSKTCVHCGSNSLHRMADSRFGIKPSAHFKYKGVLKTYYLVKIDHVEGDTYSVHVWTIDSDNAYFENYVETQMKNGADHCNLLPGSYDFHMCGPKLVFKVIFTLSKTPSYITESYVDSIEEDVPYACLNKTERAHFAECKMIKYQDAIRVLTLRKKTHGKKRGDTKRDL